MTGYYDSSSVKGLPAHPSTNALHTCMMGSVPISPAAGTTLLQGGHYLLGDILSHSNEWYTVNISCVFSFRQTEFVCQVLL